MAVVSNPLTLNTSTFFFLVEPTNLHSISFLALSKNGPPQEEKIFGVNLPDEVYSVQTILCGYQVILQVTRG